MLSAKGCGAVKWVVCCGLIGLLASASLGADRNPGRRRVYSIIDRFTQALTHVTLTEDQKPKVAAIMQKESARADDLAQHTEDPSKAERQQALGDFIKQIHQDLAQVLNVGQMETLELYMGPGPASRPTTDDFSGNVMWRNLPKALAKLDLSADVRKRVDAIMDASRQKMNELRAETDNGGVVLTQMAQLRQDVKTQLESVLTTEEMQTVVQTMAQLRQNQSGATTRPGNRASEGNNASGDPGLDQSGNDGGQSSGGTLAEIGSAAPDLKIEELNGHLFVPGNYKGHVLVLEFGSMSCPEFRDRVEAMENLRSAEGPRAFFLMVYTREAFPAGNDVQRNTDQNISVVQATSSGQRILQAEKTQQALHISMTMGVDSMDNGVSNALGTFPNGVVVIGKDGKIAAAERACDAEALRHSIDLAYDGAGAAGQ